MYSPNKHRFRNFFIGLSLSCAFVLWAFNYRIDYDSTGIMLSDPFEEGEHIYITGFSIPTPTVSHKAPNRQRTQLNHIPNAQIRVVNNTRIVTQASLFSRPTPQQVLAPQLSAPSARSTIYKQVDMMPEFPGGLEAMDAYLKAVLNVDADCIDLLYEDSINVTFIIDEYGEVNRVRMVQKDLPPCIKFEVLRAIQEMPSWRPGRHQGQPVKVLFTKPFRFRS